MIRVGMNLISQETSGVCAGVWQTGPEFSDLMHFGSSAAHVLIQADVLLTPVLVKETGGLQGRGISGVYMSGWTDSCWRDAREIHGERLSIQARIEELEREIGRLRALSHQIEGA